MTNDVLSLEICRLMNTEKKNIDFTNRYNEFYDLHREFRYATQTAWSVKTYDALAFFKNCLRTALFKLIYLLPSRQAVTVFMGHTITAEYYRILL